MTEPPIRFDDGAAYERMMGVWSQLAGEQFFDWIGFADGQRWIDIGCGNGAFTDGDVDTLKARLRDRLPADKKAGSRIRRAPVR